MKSSRLPVLAGVVLFVLCLPVMSDAGIAKYKKYFNIANVVESCKLVAVGRVTSTDFVCRQDLGATTDITLEIEDMIKGVPNGGEDHVKFMIKGGQSIDPTTGRSVRSRVPGTPTFAVNERIIVMLSIKTRIVH